MVDVSEILTCNGTQNQKCRITINTTVLKYEKRFKRIENNSRIIISLSVNFHSCPFGIIRKTSLFKLWIFPKLDLKRLHLFPNWQISQRKISQFDQGLFPKMDRKRTVNVQCKLCHRFLLIFGIINFRLTSACLPG